MKIYVAGPYGRRAGATPEQCENNTYEAIYHARELIKRGHTPFVPHLYHWVHKGWKDTPTEDGWWDICAAWLENCEAIYLLPRWYTSKGALRELDKALDLPNIGNIFTKLQEVPDATRPV